MTDFSNINRLDAQDNIGGGHYFLFIPPDHIASDPEVIDNNIPNAITLEAGKSWYKAEFSQMILKFLEPEKLTKGNHTTIPTLNGSVPKDNLQNLNILFSMAKKGLVVLYYNNNGEARMIGSKESPARLVRKTNHGDESQKNASAFSISATAGQGGAPFYESAIPAINVCIGDTPYIRGNFEAGYPDLPDFEVGSDAAGTYVAVVTDGVSDPLVYKVNNIVVTLPITLIAADILSVTRQNYALDGFYKLTQ